MGLKAFFVEWAARRAGRRGVERDLARSAREVVGPTGWMLSRGWEAMEKGSPAYVKSFDRKLPPSLFVSERDRTRSNIPVPLVERCIEDVTEDTLSAPDSPS